MDTTQDSDIDRLFGLHGRDVAGPPMARPLGRDRAATAVLLPPSHRASPSPGGAAGITPPVADVEAPGSTRVDRTGAARHRRVGPGRTGQAPSARDLLQRRGEGDAELGAVGGSAVWAGLAALVLVEVVAAGAQLLLRFLG